MLNIGPPSQMNGFLNSWTRTRQPTYDPRDGGCFVCFHVRRAHERGKDTPRSCTSLGCECPGFRTRRLVLGRWRRG